MKLAARIMNKPLDMYRFVTTYSQHLPQAFNALFSMPCVVSLLQGTLRKSDARVSVLYAGRRANVDYLSRMAFDDYRIVDQVITNLLAFKPHMQRMSDAADMIVLDLGWPYNNRFNRKHSYLEVPDWINMAIEFPSTWDDVVANFRRTARKHDMRLIRRNDYRCEISSSLEDIEKFYDEMYVPFLTHRHAAESVVAPRKHVIKRGLRGKLLQVIRGDEIVAAGVIYPERETMFSLWMGIPKKHLEHQPEAAISALYYFGIQYAFSNGYEIFDFTGTRAFLNDGAFQFKRRWGPVVEDGFSPSSILLKPKSDSRQAALFCQQVPVLIRTVEGLEAVFVRVAGTAGDGADQKTFARLEKDFGCAGMARMNVIEISNESETRTMPIGGKGCQYRLIKCPLETFAEKYVSIGCLPGAPLAQPQPH